ncbi:sugar phosphate isomerase/epimerase family protein [Alteromonas macleodii]|uniref:sugar phosphate isomerase/epimerase family protein n=1 Tax=Alteromonas macleodii TaxID=28108 RepID=UPI0022AFEF66|nr:sugar phosphate isomerase/epimerase [Alteromonas macleodii]MCZ4240716.1 sugar phosphate isomerase/epimerase [Alteromonas macleodii]
MATNQQPIKGPAIFLAQFMGKEAPFDTLENMAKWAASLGYKGIQVPTDPSLFDLEKAAESQEYCDNIAKTCKDAGVEITELSTHLQGQLVAVHPAYDELFDNFAPAHLHGKPQERTEWAINQLKCAAIASKRLGLKAHATFSGALMWHLVYPWPQRPAGLVEQGFAELAKRWKPILDAFDDAGVDVCYEIHPGEDLHDGASFEQFLKAVDNHPRANILFDPSHFVLQQLDYLDFIDRYHSRIKMFHVKDAEFNPNGRNGVYGGYQDWQDRAGRFRSLGDGQVDFKGIFSKLTQYGFTGWAVLEWECCLKDSAQGAAEGAPFIASHIIEPSKYAFDDFAGGDVSEAKNNRILGLER